MTFMSRDEYEEARAEDWLEERALADEEARQFSRDEPEDFDPIWEATVHGELDDRVDDADWYDGDYE